MPDFAKFSKKHRIKSVMLKYEWKPTRSRKCGSLWLWEDLCEKALFSSFWRFFPQKPPDIEEKSEITQILNSYTFCNQGKSFFCCFRALSFVNSLFSSISGGFWGKNLQNEEKSAFSHRSSHSQSEPHFRDLVGFHSYFSMTDLIRCFFENLAKSGILLFLNVLFRLKPENGCFPSMC